MHEREGVLCCRPTSPRLRRRRGEEGGWPPHVYECWEGFIDSFAGWNYMVQAHNTDGHSSCETSFKVVGVDCCCLSCGVGYASIRGLAVAF